MSVFLKHMEVHYLYYDTNCCSNAEWKRLLRDATKSTLEHLALLCSTRVEGGCALLHVSPCAHANMLVICTATSGADRVAHPRLFSGQVYLPLNT